MTKKVLILLALFAVAAFADNIRPVAIGNSPGGEAALQTILNQIYGCTGCVSATNDQNTTDLWLLAGAPVQTAGPVLKARYAADNEAVGIYTGNTLVDIFLPGALAEQTALLQFNVNGTLSIGAISGCGTAVNCNTFSGINQYDFGFYLKDNTASHTYYTEDSRNGTVIPNFATHNNGTARALAYVHGTNQRWAIAFEDGSDFDYNDRVMSIESIQSVPEPGIILLLGGMLAGVAVLRKRAA